MGLDIGREDVLIRFTLLSVLLSGGCCSLDAPRSAQDIFFERLSSYCGQAFAGQLVSTEAPDADMAAMPMVMHIRNCSESEIRVPFHVGNKDGGWDRSRSWVITRTPSGLRLKHDHRHQDGSPDIVTMYGGDTAAGGSVARQEFVVDADSIAMFNREGLPKSVTNIWAVEVGNAGTFAYELRRIGENQRFFRVEFDLTKAIETPPPPWGS